MNLRLRLALAFAAVALVTAGLIVAATPTIVGRGFARMAADASGTTSTPGMGQGMGQGQGAGPGPMAGVHAAQIEQETTLTIVALALVAAAGASLLGVLLASRIVRPLEALEVVAAAVAHGDLERRSGIADRRDEIGSLGRSFDAMTDDLAGAEEARRRFFADAAHELKTPLSVIDATTSALIDGVYEHDDRHLQTIREQSRLLGRIVDDLRTVSLAETSGLPLHRTPIALDSFIRSSVDEFAARARVAGVRLVVASTTHVSVRADPDRLRQAISALLDNAIRLTPAGGEVSVGSAVGPDGMVRVSVRDTGPGIAPEDLPHLFDRFYQADAARDRTSGTSGLGLAVMRALILAHGGRVGVENAETGGARFWFELPIDADGSRRAPAVVHPPVAREVLP
jgi:two-component system sensor histidine kinase BaeS